MTFARITDRIEQAAGSVPGILGFLAWVTFAPMLNIDVSNYGISVYTAGILVFTLAATRRDRLAVHVKLDDLERAVADARTENARLEEKTEAEIIEARDALDEAIPTRGG